MNEFKGTPGPWSIETYFPGWFDIRAKIGNRDWASTFASVHTNNAVEQDPAETEPNARLIAAAPELLAALDNLACAFEQRMDDEENATWHEEYVAARAAIAKALGDE